MASNPVIPAILIGGAGTRLWPLSRGNKPKQFLRLVGANSLFQDTVLRFDAEPFGKPWLLTNAETLHHAQLQLAEHGRTAAAVIIEPSMQGTAAALAALALLAARTSPEALIIAAPADHVIEQPAAFRAAVERAVPLAASGSIVTFGIAPTAPETGFGYIRGDQPLLAGEQPVGFSIGAGGFLEKPSRELAEAFIAKGYFWNAGIFLFKASTLIAEFEIHAPETLLAASKSVKRGLTRIQRETTYWHLDAEAFAQAPADLPIDTAIMEVTDKAAVVPCTDIGWSDVGSLSALWEIADKNESANVVHGDALCIETSGSLIYSRGNRKVVAGHLKDLMIVDTDDCLVVLPRERAQEVKGIVKNLKASESPEINYSREAVFGWGRMRVIGGRTNSVTAEVELQPQAAFGPRYVDNDAETWVVAAGEILATLNGRVMSLECGATLKLKRGDVVTIEAMSIPADCIAVFTSGENRTLQALVASSKMPAPQAIGRTLPPHELAGPMRIGLG